MSASTLNADPPQVIKMNECEECNELKTETELATTPSKCGPHFCWDCLMFLGEKEVY